MAGRDPAGSATVLAFAALAMLAGAAVALQVANLGGGFLSDDLAHVAMIHGEDARSALPAWVLARFVEPLGNGTFAYRPLAFASYALDWWIWRENAAGWRATSVALFVANAVAAGALVWCWLAGHAPHARFAALLGACMLAAYPFVGEISWWLVGRFDLLACLFGLLYLIALPLDRASSPGRHALRLAFLACALWSRESAVPLPLIATLLAFCVAFADAEPAARRAAALRTTIRETAPSWLLLAAYLGWRYALFGSVLKVYQGSTAPRSLPEWWARTSGVADIVAANVGAHALAWTVAAVALVAALVVVNVHGPGGNARVRALAPPLLAGLVLYAAAPALSFPVSSAGGEGARHFYPAWLYASLLAALLVARRRAAWPFGIALVAVLLAGQAQSLRQWHAAGTTMDAVAAGVARFAPTVGDRQYALLLLPDHVGAALYARTAQGAIVAPPLQPRDFLPRVAVMLSGDFAHWSDLVVNGGVARLKSSPAFDPADFLGVWCWNPQRRAFVPLTGGEYVRDPERWRAAAQANFARAGCLAPF